MPDILAPADWTFPVPVHYGPGRIAELGALARRAGMARPLIVTDRGSRSLPFIARAEALLAAAGIAGAVFADVAPNPTERDAAAGRAAFRAGGHDGVIGIGGGSGMDAAKAVALTARNGHDLWAFDYDGPALPDGARDCPPMILVPTTAGTGAETESTAMVTDTARGIKRCVWHPGVKPAAALLDPELTLGLPVSLTAWTGCDALVHAIEALSVPVWHPPCDAMALEALRLIGRWLPEAVADGGNLEARGGMLVGSMLAGVAFIKGLGLVHAMSHMVGAVHDTQHGLTNAVLLPVVLRFNRPALGDKTALMCRALGLRGEGFDDLHGWVVALLDRVGIPRDLAALGVTEASLPGIAVKAHGDVARATNPVQASPAEIEVLLREAFGGAR